MTRRARLAFACFFLAILYLVPLTQVGIEIARGGRAQFIDLFITRPVRQQLRAWEHELEESSVFAQAARPWVQAFWFTLLKDPGAKVLVGRDEWLFYKPDMRYLVEPAAFDADHDDPCRAIVDFRDQLARQGTRLIVLPVPGKPAVYPDKLTRRVNGNGIRSQTLDLIARLRAAGIETIDLFQEFRSLRQSHGSPPLYLLRDSHWSPQTAQATAEVVAARVSELGWVKSGTTEYAVRQVLVQRRGDLTHMIRVPEIENRYPAEQVQATSVVGYKDDPFSPVLVVGDSFLRIYQRDEPKAAGFIAHLARVLRMPLATVVNDGGASTLVRQELSRRGELLRGKKLVIWEFVERDIRFGAEGWKLIQLAVPEHSYAHSQHGFVAETP